MRVSRLISTVDAHAEGEIGRVVTGGVLGIEGATMAEKMARLNNEDAGLRRFLVSEPRAACAMTTNLLLPPTRPDADAGFIVMQIDRAHAMSGSNAMCVTTVLLETGILPMTEPESVVRLDTPAGLVVARATCRDGRCERVALDMPPSFALDLDVAIEVPGIGRVVGDVAFGGVFYFLVDADQLGLSIAPASARALVAAGIDILAAANKALDPRHPENPALSGISYVMFRGWDDAEQTVMRNATILWPGRIDRSPCGTGSAARTAALAARGLLRAGGTLTARSTIGGAFTVEVLGEARVGGRSAILPRVSGRAWVYGSSQLMRDPTDPFPEGFTLSDTWGPGLG
jgi:proline racemase